MDGAAKLTLPREVGAAGEVTLYDLRVLSFPPMKDPNPQTQKPRRTVQAPGEWPPVCQDSSSTQVTGAYRSGDPATQATVTMSGPSLKTAPFWDSSS